MPEEESWESGVSTKAIDAVMRMLGRLPETWSLARKARKAAESLPTFAGDVEVPCSDEIYSWIDGICQTPHRRPGTPEGHQAENWVAERFREFGLLDVTMDPVPMTAWSADSWSLRYGGRTVPSFYIPYTALTGPDGVTGELVYAGTGSKGSIDRMDVKGRIVVAEVTFPVFPTGLLLKGLRSSYYVSDPDGYVSLSGRQYMNFVRQNFMGGAADAAHAPDNDVYWRACAGGAAGVCLVLKDQPAGTNTHYGPYDGVMKPIPGLWVGKHEAKELIESARRGVSATLTLEGSAVPGTMNNVWGILPGMSDDVILITSHHDSPFTGAVEDGAGVAQVLAQARAWSRVPREERPLTLIFVVDAGHFYGSEGGRAFARQHPDIMSRTRLLVTLEHLGAKEVRESGREYVETGRIALTVMFTTPDTQIVAMTIRALKSKPARVTAVIPSDLLAPVPTSDALGYLSEVDVPVVSWIGCPYYLLDDKDTLDKVQKDELGPIAETVTELIKSRMAIG
jgi:hypothetical protein